MIEIFALAFALSMDAFAVSIGLGIKNKEDIKILALKAGLFFGIFQALMPFIGHLGGVGIQKYIQGFDTIIACILLLLIGGNMIYNALNKTNKEDLSKITNKLLFLLAIATSIDAMAAGFTLHLFDLNVYLSLCIIGFTTFIVSYLGVYVGSKGGLKYESKAEILGGVVLIIIGVKIFFVN